MNNLIKDEVIWYLKYKVFTDNFDVLRTIEFVADKFYSRPTETYEGFYSTILDDPNDVDWSDADVEEDEDEIIIRIPKSSYLRSKESVIYIEDDEYRSDIASVCGLDLMDLRELRRKQRDCQLTKEQIIQEIKKL